ncbi:inorganic phosphate transporter [Salibacter halophilus]|uniref:Gx transporter family protein n=1 Tax=Salibacter halophilus TaxID=1803916 RepID=A0A6N6ME57_9FLAO|nr:Gx transporter family protein [Salibacter halophilus]KAB1065995.1 Gx transporter family protein [Salibacter halophilus]
MLTERQRLELCKKCLNRKFDTKTGVVCGLTDEKPTFDETCPDFKKDTSVKDRVDDEHIGYSSKDLKSKIPAEEYDRLIDEQNWDKAVIAGAVVALLGSVLWGVFAYAFGMMLSITAAVIGFLISLTVRKFGKGIEKKFTYLSIAFSLISLIIGHMLAIVFFTASQSDLSVLEVLSSLGFTGLVIGYFASFSLPMIFFYVAAIISSFYVSERKISAKDIQEMNSRVFEGKA